MRRLDDGKARGAVMVEMAIVVPIFILLVFGMLEFGLAFKDRLAMAHAAQTAARVAAVQGNEDVADREILKGFTRGLSAVASLDAVKFVDVFKANPDGTPGPYDRYTPADSTCGWDPCPDPDEGVPIYGIPSSYPPCGRDTAFDPEDGVDTIGVRVTYTHGWVTGVLGLSESTWEETTRRQIESVTFGTQDPSC
jgi:TadE-like protein